MADTGYIRKCMEETFAGVTVADLVREMLANPDSENAHVFTAEEQREFLFHVFARLATGGGACQWEDEVRRRPHELIRALKPRLGCPD